MPVLYIVVPCFNEQEVLPLTAKKLKEKLDSLKKNKKISESSKILFVNDGSRDKTGEIITEFYNNSDKTFCALTLSRNYGHQNALIAGIEYAQQKADAIITIDADLQDDIDIIDEMLKKFKEGNEIVYGVRNDRKEDSAFKRSTAVLFYKILRLLGAEIVSNHADFRLLGKKAAKALCSFSEVNLFLRGIVPMVGFKSTNVYYKREKRAAGVTKYPLKRMISFGLNGVTSLSIKPIRLISGLGVIMLIISVLMGIYALISYFCGNYVSGWTSIILSIWAIGGLQLLSIGIIGEYIGKIYLETKRRPRYFIEKTED